jgi:methionyl-tRNA formyltransferase
MKVVVFGNKDTTRTIINYLIKINNMEIIVVNLAPNHNQVSNVAGYTDLKDVTTPNNISIYRPARYDLNCVDDVQYLSSLNADIGLVMGWQRLIPENILSSMLRGAFGMHGSSEGLPRGRGRSPLNWSILEGRTHFVTSLFRYKPGVDDGDVVASQIFEITPEDDCETLHLKNTLSMKFLLEENLPSIYQNSIVLQPQDPNIDPTYYCKRSPELGRIDWSNITSDFFVKMVRAQTRPFPGAHAFVNEQVKIYFWKAQIFDRILPYRGYPAGTVLDRFSNNRFLLATWDGTVLVNEWSTGDANYQPRTNDRFI